MGQYTNKGLYNSYKKNNKERAELDYYATPTAEVVNILETLNYDFSCLDILKFNFIWPKTSIRVV